MVKFSHEWVMNKLKDDPYYFNKNQYEPFTGSTVLTATQAKEFNLELNKILQEIGDKHLVTENYSEITLEDLLEMADEDFTVEQWKTLVRRLSSTPQELYVEIMDVMENDED